MGERQVAYAAAVAAPTSGALCALAYLLTEHALGGTTRVWGGVDDVVLAWLFIGVWYGIAVGVLCGILPGILAVALWPTFAARLGVRGGILALSVVVGTIGVGEVATLGVNGAAWPWAVGAGVVCAGTSALVLWIFHRRTAA